LNYSFLGQIDYGRAWPVCGDQAVAGGRSGRFGTKSAAPRREHLPNFRSAPFIIPQGISGPGRGPPPGGKKAMDAPGNTPDQPATPLEEFVRTYLETIGGAWDEVEPQVYDVLLPAGEAAPPLPPAANGLPRITFDPEALPEHSGAQLASF